MNTTNKIALRNAFQKFISISDKDWAKIEAKIEIKSYKSGDLFINVGQISNSLGFITKGFFRKYYIKNGNDINFWFYSENQFLVAYQSFLERVPTDFYIEAIEDAEILIISYDTLQEIYTYSDEFQKLGRLVCEKMYLAHHNRIVNLLLYDATTRYKNLIKNHPLLLQRLPQYHLASYLGIKPQSLSRIRKENM